MIGRTACIALALLAGVAAQQARSTKLEVVEVPRCDGGSTNRIDLDRVEKNYRDVASDVKRALAGFEKAAVAKLEDGYDAGLPDPTRPSSSIWKPAAPLPEQLRGITIYVVTIDQNGMVYGLPRSGRRREDVVLISRAARLRDCASLAPVTLLTRELAATLGIRTSRGRCTISLDGTQIAVTEGDQP